MEDKQSKSIWEENEDYLKRMANMAQKRLAFLNKFKNQQKEDWYVRVAGDSCRAVSLNNKTPLMGYAKHGTQNEDVLLNNF